MDDIAEGWQPVSVPSATVHPLTDEQVEQFRAAWLKAQHGHPKVLGLPWRVRLRLSWQQAVTDAGIWLCDRRMWWAAGLLWWRR